MNNSYKSDDNQNGKSESINISSKDDQPKDDCIMEENLNGDQKENTSKKKEIFLDGIS
jgi:hypothetical protein